MLRADSLNVVDILDARDIAPPWPHPSYAGRPALATDEVLRVTALTAADVILRPVISEKSIDVSTLGDRDATGQQVHVRGPREANKIQIKAAVEELYQKEKVTVVAVNVLTTKSKEKRRGTRRGRIVGRTPRLAQGRS